MEDASNAPGAGGKKLVQARLPFQALTPKTPVSLEFIKNKLSQFAKSSKISDNNKVTKEVVLVDFTEVSSSSTERGNSVNGNELVKSDIVVVGREIDSDLEGNEPARKKIRFSNGNEAPDVKEIDGVAPFLDDCSDASVSSTMLRKRKGKCDYSLSETPSKKIKLNAVAINGIDLNKSESSYGNCNDVSLATLDKANDIISNENNIVEVKSLIKEVVPAEDKIERPCGNAAEEVKLTLDKANDIISKENNIVEVKSPITKFVPAEDKIEMPCGNEAEEIKAMLNFSKEKNNIPNQSEKEAETSKSGEFDSKTFEDSLEERNLVSETSMCEEEEKNKSVCSDIGESSDKMTPPLMKNIKPRKTPKQLEKAAELARKREEKAKLKEEREKKKLQEKEEKQKHKEEKEVLKKKELEEKEEQKRKLREEKEEQRKRELEEKEEMKRKLREEKEKRKQLEIDVKNEEKKRRDEEKRRKEEELQRKKEEDAALKIKYAKEAVAFSNFFTKVDQKKPETPPKETVLFKPFAVKSGMRLAPILRVPMTEFRINTLLDTLKNQSECETYITQLRCGDIKPGSTPNTWPLEEKDEDNDDVVVEDLDLPEATAISAPKRRLLRPKLLQFSENKRPSYWGTWRKKCPQVRPRNPFGQFKDFDYEVDSDEEWEEEEPGESLHGSDDEKDAEEEDDYEVDNDFFVPHGYLSEDEEQDEEEAFSPEKMKAKLKLLGEQFDKERNEKTRQLRPIVIGCVWFTQGVAEVHTKIAALLCNRAAFPWQEEIPIDTTRLLSCGDLDVSEMADGDSPPRTASKRVQFPVDGVPILLKIAHGATVNRRTISSEFLSYWSHEHPQAPLPSMSLVSRKVKELAQWQECHEEPLVGKYCWFVSRELREQNGCGDLSLPNAWEFPNRRASDIQDDTLRITKFTKVLSEEERRQLLATEPDVEPIISDEKKSSPVLKITKFTKVLTEEERKLQLKPNSPTPVLSPKPVDSTGITATINKLNQFRATPTVKKRVALLSSVPLTTPKVDSTQPIKKKVAILFSAPCGVDIVKPTGDGSFNKEGGENAVKTVLEEKTTDDS